MKIAILIIAAFIQVIQIFKKKENTLFKKKWLNITFLGFEIFTVIGLVVFTIIEIKDNQRENKIAALRGDFGNQKDSESRFPTLKIGSSIFNNNGAGDFTFGTPVPPIKIATANEQLLVFADIRDSKGDVFASISGRTWEIKDPANIEYNNDETAFEIISGGRVVFQIQLKKDTVLYNGLLCSESGGCYYINNAVMMRMGKVEGTQRFILPADLDIAPIFRYPRYRNLGVRVIN